MKLKLLLLVLLSTSYLIAQNDPKTAFQKGRYELAVSYYKKADFIKAIDLFGLAAKIKPENEIGKESLKKVDTLKEVLRKEIMHKAIGSWKKAGNKPVWSNGGIVDNKNSFDEVVEVTATEILFFEVDKITKEKKEIKKETIVYNEKDNTGSLYSELILSDGTIWNCMLDEKSNILHVINVAVKTEQGIQKINKDNIEWYFVKI